MLLLAFLYYTILQLVRQKKIVKFLKKNYLLTLFISVVLFVGIIALFKLLTPNSTELYVKIKMGQGYWWANTTKPGSWYLNSFKKGDIYYGSIGKPQATIMDIRRYPYGYSQYDIFVTLKMKVESRGKNGPYSFNRTNLLIGAPIELEFPTSRLTGAIIELSKTPFKDNYVEKTVYLVNQGGYTKDFPYRYDSIKKGDKYSDGQDVVFEVLDKNLEKSIWTVTNNFNGEIYEREVETTQNIVVKVKAKFKQKDDGLYYGEENKLSLNTQLPFSTSNYFFENFYIRRIE